MADLVITVPDALAEDLRNLDIATSAVCQRALLDSVTSRRPQATPSFEAAGPSLTYRTQAVVDHARQLSAAPTSADLLRGLAAEGDFAREVLRVAGVDIGELADEVAADARTTTHRADPLDQVLDRAVARARELGSRYVGSEHLLLSLVGSAPDELVARALRVQGVEPSTLEPAVVFMLAGFAFARSSGGLASKSV